MPASEGLQRLQRLAASQSERRSLPVTAPARSEGPRQRKGSTLERGSFKYVLFFVAAGLIVAGFYIAPDFTSRPLHLMADRTLTGEEVSIGDRVLIQEDATGQATVHQLDPQDSPPMDYRGLAADALTGSDTSSGGTAGSDNQAQGIGSSSATQDTAAGSQKTTTTGDGVITVADDLVSKAQKSPVLDIGTKDGILDNQAAHAHHEGDNMMDFTKAANETGNTTAASWSAHAVNANLTQGGMFQAGQSPPTNTSTASQTPPTSPQQQQQQQGVGSAVRLPDPSTGQANPLTGSTGGAQQQAADQAFEKQAMGGLVSDASAGITGVAVGSGAAAEGGAVGGKNSDPQLAARTGGAKSPPQPQVAGAGGSPPPNPRAAAGVVNMLQQVAGAGGSPPPNPLAAGGLTDPLQKAAGTAADPPPSPVQGDPAVMKSTSALLRQKVQNASQSPPATPSNPGTVFVDNATRAATTQQQAQRLQSDTADMVLPGGERATSDVTAAGANTGGQALQDARAKLQKGGGQTGNAAGTQQAVVQPQSRKLLWKPALPLL